MSARCPKCSEVTWECSCYAAQSMTPEVSDKTPLTVLSDEELAETRAYIDSESGPGVLFSINLASRLLATIQAEREKVRATQELCIERGSKLIDANNTLLLERCGYETLKAENAELKATVERLLKCCEPFVGVFHNTQGLKRFEMDYDHPWIKGIAAEHDRLRKRVGEMG